MARRPDGRMNIWLTIDDQTWPLSAEEGPAVESFYAIRRVDQEPMGD